MAQLTAFAMLGPEADLLSDCPQLFMIVQASFSFKMLQSSFPHKLCAPKIMYMKL